MTAKIKTAATAITKGRTGRAGTRRSASPPPPVITPATPPEFRWDEGPVSTAFYRRFTAMLERALDEGLWIILCGQPGDGKSTAIEGFLASPSAPGVDRRDGRPGLRDARSTGC